MVGALCAIAVFLGMRLLEVTVERDALKADREHQEDVFARLLEEEAEESDPHQRTTGVLQDLQARPPLGLQPRHIWEMQRLEQIGAAIERYTDAQKQVPTEWFAEHEELRTKLKPHLGKL